MKKVLLALIAIVFASSAAFAIGAGDIGIGVGVNTAAGLSGASVEYYFTDDIAAGLTLDYLSTSPSPPGVSNAGLSAKVKYLLPTKLGGVTPLVGLQYAMNGAATGGEIAAIDLLLGAQVEVAPRVGIEFGIVPYTSVSGAGTPFTSAMGTVGGYLLIHTYL